MRVSQYNERAIGGSARSAWLKIDIAASDSIDEQKAVVDLAFTARDDDENGKWEKGDYALLRLTLWIGSAVEEGGGRPCAPQGIRSFTSLIPIQRT